MTKTRDSGSSIEKKRLRDRRAQQAKRDKRETHLKELEDQVEFCKRHHGAAWIERLVATLESLRRENKMLLARQEQLCQLVSSWSTAHDVDHSNTFPTPLVCSTDVQYLKATNSPVSTSDLLPVGVPALNGSGSIPKENAVLTNNQSWDRDDKPEGLSTAAVTPLSEGISGSSGSINLPKLPSLPSPQATSTTVPTWCLTPMNEYGHNPSYTIATCAWLSRPDLIANCPPAPSALDILHGTRQNYLADQINRKMRSRALREPECLASGWLSYVYSKWLVCPNPATFDHVPQLLRPVVTQIQKGHPNALDLIMWPQLRINLIEKWTKYDFMEVANYLCCCAKVRWPWGLDILERDAEDNLQIKREFFDTFTRESGWGLTSEFIEKYPELLEGMDVEAIRFRIKLP